MNICGLRLERMKKWMRCLRRSAKIDICLVNYDNDVRMSLYDILDIRNTHQNTCRRIGIRKNDTAAFSHIILFSNAEIRIERLHFVWNPGYVLKGNRAFGFDNLNMVRAEKRQNGELS